MADIVQYEIEQMICELEELQVAGILSGDEVKKVIKSRRKFEYNTRRYGKELVDFLRYIEYELNLGFLVKNRVSRSKDFKGKSQYGSIDRIHALFQRALRKFSGDKRLWFQFMDFAVRAKNCRPLGKIFADAIALHPAYAPFWIIASAFEYFYNENIEAARALLQRANRTNPNSREILLEYCRLELAYRLKIQIQIQLNGPSSHLFTSNNSSQQPTSSTDPYINTVMDQIESDHLIDEDVQKLNKVEKDSSDKLGTLERLNLDFQRDGLADPANSTSNLFLQGAIPLLVAQKLISLYPHDFMLRKKLVHIFTSFPNTNYLVDQIYDSIRVDFDQDPVALSFYARRPYDFPELEIQFGSKMDSDPMQANPSPFQIQRLERDLFMKVNLVIENFEELCKVYPQSKIYVTYIDFLIMVLHKVDPSMPLKSNLDVSKIFDGSVGVEKGNTNEHLQVQGTQADPGLSKFLHKKLMTIFSKLDNLNLLSEPIAIQWLDILLAREELEQALNIGRKIASIHGSSPMVQLAYFSIIKTFGYQLSTHGDQLQAQYGSEKIQHLKLEYDWDFNKFYQAIQETLKHVQFTPSLAPFLQFYWQLLIDESTKSQLENIQSVPLKRAYLQDSPILSIQDDGVRLDGNQINQHGINGECILPRVIESYRMILARMVEFSMKSSGLSTQIGLDLVHYAGINPSNIFIAFKTKTLQVAITKLVPCHHTIQVIRILFETGLEYPPNPKPYYELAIEFESQNQTTEGAERTRALYQRAIREFGTFDTSIWLKFIAWEKKQTYPKPMSSRINQIYHQAKRTLANPDEFLTQYFQTLQQEPVLEEDPTIMQVDNPVQMEADLLGSIRVT